METKNKKEMLSSTSDYFKAKLSVKKVGTFLLFFMFLFAAAPASAHCDSYDGPVIKDAYKALETNNVKLVFKWIKADQESEIRDLFNKTYSLRKGDKEIYAIVEKHFFETLVRLHRATENAPYTGLKSAGTTSPFVMMSDDALKTGDINGLLDKLTNHIKVVAREKFQKVAELDKVKDTSVEKGREYVKSYVDYIHTLDAIHKILEHKGAEPEGAEKAEKPGHTCD